MSLALLRLAIGGIFVAAGALKIADLPQFALEVSYYELTSWTVSVLVALYLPWLEIFAGVALVVRKLELGALLALALLMLLFLGALGSAWARGLDITCGCFGREGDALQTNFPLLFARDLALLAGVVILLAAALTRAPSGESLPAS